MWNKNKTNNTRWFKATYNSNYIKSKLTKFCNEDIKIKKILKNYVAYEKQTSNIKTERERINKDIAKINWKNANVAVQISEKIDFQSNYS
jgi:hypothetical protein